MCTMTIIRLTEPSAGIRIAFNRDESRSRPPALPPVIRAFGDNRAVLPIYGQAGGTWIAASDVGLVFAVLNVNASPGMTGQRAKSPLSRGVIIPKLLGANCLTEAIEYALRLELSGFAPFRLVIADRTTAMEMRSAECDLRVKVHNCEHDALLFTSSGLGDEVVESPRRSLFSAMFADEHQWATAQSNFHRHQWKDRPEISVSMSRADACTVSFTVVDVGPESISLSYTAGAPNDAVMPVRRRLTRKSKVLK
jgi:hypothetical protein